MLKHHHKLFYGLGLAIAVIFAAYSVHYFFNKNEGRIAMSDGTTSALKLTSQEFKEGENIPVQYTCKGQNVSPPLAITGVPEQAKSLALILHDPDAVNGDFVHWLMWDMPTSTANITANSVPVGAIQGQNGAGAGGYMGPCPPKGTGTHHYIFELYALDKSLGLDSKTNREELKKAMQGHVVSQFNLTGLFAAD